MKILSFLHLPIWAISNLTETGLELDFFGSPRFNETCDALDNAILCETHCHNLYSQCVEKCPEPTDQEIG